MTSNDNSRDTSTGGAERKECPDCEVVLEVINRHGQLWCPDCERCVWQEGEQWWGQNQWEDEPVQMGGESHV